ncbi:hypothetical protein IHV25_05950 [Phaeovibrio sulfidiphilus]|uniref:Uncharacterized protein n=1 Tax=Phaeovibrio sulfidiphilus TaxID=1220600 RepID=A0A8J7CDP8_9PROT|nr:hypothetical protein [Phaeovibrio sulfidiphilus]MBE1237189.1 hypothetical protein [Phaeovibrio sulfidiphilus]
MSEDEIERIGDRLSRHTGFWEHWGFSPWAEGPFRGVARHQRFVKSGVLGPVAEYGARDVIVWSCGTGAEREALWRSVRPVPDVITQRFLFLLPEPWTGRRIRSFLLGFRGYVEFYAVSPGGAPAHRRVRDLSGLVDLALGLDAPA